MKALLPSILFAATLGSSVGATLTHVDQTPAPALAKVGEVAAVPTPGQIAAWKATATISDYIAPAPPR